MAIENRTSDYKSHKYKRTVYVNLNPKTKIGSDLIGQYKEQSQLHCLDLGRIGSHDEHGKYKIDYYTVKELIVIPKLIIRVTEKAMNRAGRDVYELRTYMSKFGQLNFLLVVDKDYADLILVENVYIENLNHRENYETLLWRLSYYNQKPLPLAEIFYKYGIKANPEDYGKSWKEEDIKINNVLAAKSMAMMTASLANKVGSVVSQKALVASLNNLNKEGEYGKKITDAYSAKVAKNKEINKLATSQKLENTLNHFLIKTLEEQTTKKDLAEPDNLRVYKRVIDIQFSAPNAIAEEVERHKTKQNFKDFLLQNYQKTQSKGDAHIDEKEVFDKSQDEFEQIIEHKFSRKPHVERIEKNEEKLEVSKIAKKNLPKEYFDFEGNKIFIDLNTERFFEKESSKDKKLRESKEKQQEKTERRDQKNKQKAIKKLRKVNAKCDIEAEYERSKTYVGLTPEFNKPRDRVKAIFARKEKDKLSKRSKIEQILNGKEDQKESSENILDKLQKKIKNQSAKQTKRQEEKAKKIKEKEEKKKIRLQKKEEKRKKRNNTALHTSEKQRERKKKIDTTQVVVKKEQKAQGKQGEEIRPVLKPKENISDQKQNKKANIVKQEDKTQGQEDKSVKQQILQTITKKIQQQEPQQTNNENLQTEKTHIEKHININNQAATRPVKQETHFDISRNVSTKKEKTLEM